MDIYAVGQVSSYLKESLESNDFLADIWISGELSNVSRSTAGHLYFTLKDTAGQLRCVRFRNALTEYGLTAPSPSADTGQAVENGTAVVAHGRISFYEARGDLQFIVDVLMPQGAGSLYLEFQRLKAKLAEEGLFDESRKRPLPEFPQRIAVVTSPTGAVLHDITTIVGRRYPLVELLVMPVSVQGEAASAAIAAAFRALNQRRDIDVVILARGGGSLEELWPFNEERTARAVYSSHAPVISAVGHETDYTIVDYVADLRAATPSAAAELAVPDRRELAMRVVNLQTHLRSAVEGFLRDSRDDLADAQRGLGLMRPDLARERMRVDDLTQSASQHLREGLSLRRAMLGQHMATLVALDPQRTLERGYAIVRRQKTGDVVLHRTQVASGDLLDIRVSDGTFGATADGAVLSLSKGAVPTRSRKAKAPAKEQLALLP